MPKVGKGKEAAEFPYTKEGVEAAEDFAQKTNQEINYPTNDAQKMRETYQLGGIVGQNAFPGDPLFGQKPIVKPPLPGAVLPGTAATMGMYEEGGAVDKYYKKGGSVMTSAERDYAEYKKEKKRKSAQRDLEKSGYGGLTKREKIKLAKKKKRADAGKASREHFGLSKIKKRMKAKKVVRQEKIARIKAIKEGKETSASKLEMARFKLGKKK